MSDLIVRPLSGLLEIIEHEVGERLGKEGLLAFGLSMSQDVCQKLRPELNRLFSGDPASHRPLPPPLREDVTRSAQQEMTRMSGR